MTIIKRWIAKGVALALPVLMLNNISNATPSHASPSHPNPLHALGAVVNKDAAPPPPHTGSGLSVPNTVDLSQFNPPVGDQGGVNSCVAWATGYYLRGWYAKRDGYYPTGGSPTSGSFAPMYTYAQIVKGQNNGTTFPANLDIQKGQGIDRRGHYTQGDYDYTDQPSASEKAIAATYTIAGYADAGSPRQTWIETTFASGNPIAIMIPVYPEFDNGGDKNHLVGEPLSSEQSRGNHAVFAYKYDQNGLWIENQWGTGWGDHGYAELSWAFVNQYAEEAVTIAPIAAPQLQPRVTVAPSLLPLNVPVSTQIGASDPDAQISLAGTATVHNFDAQGHPISFQVPTNTPFTTTFHTGVSKTWDCVDLPKPHCFWVKEVVYPEGTVSVPGYASVEIPFQFTNPTPHRLLVQVDPSSALPGGRPVSVTVRSVDATTLVPVAGRVVLYGQDVGPTNSPFTTTFTAPPSGFVRAAGYRDAPISWPAYQPSHLQVLVTPFPPPLKRAVSVTIAARDADAAAHEGVAGTATIHNYDAHGSPVLLQIPTNTQTTVTFYAHVTRTRECDGGGGGPTQKPHCWWNIQTDYPSGTVSAPGFQDQAIDFGFPVSQEH